MMAIVISATESSPWSWERREQVNLVWLVGLGNWQCFLKKMALKPRPEESPLKVGWVCVEERIADGSYSRGRPGAAKALGAVEEAQGLWWSRGRGRVGRGGWTCKALQRILGSPKNKWKPPKGLSNGFLFLTCKPIGLVRIK